MHSANVGVAFEYPWVSSAAAIRNVLPGVPKFVMAEIKKQIDGRRPEAGNHPRVKGLVYGRRAGQRAVVRRMVEALSACRWRFGDQAVRRWLCGPDTGGRQ